MSRMGINAVPVAVGGDNGGMDTTQMEELLSQLEEADPAEAPDIADAVTAGLAASLDGQPGEPMPEQDPEPGGGS